MTLLVDIEKRLKDFHLSAKFESGDEFLGVLGASGAGKSMLLKCIAGIETPDSGRIILDGRTLYDSERKINLPPQSRQVGYLFQDYALFPNMTVKQNVLCGLRNERDKLRQKQILSRTLELLQLRGLEERKPSQLSGGEAQRTALARILVNMPVLLMLDEPFSALDIHLRPKLRVLLRDLLKGYGVGVLLVTHDSGEAFSMCDRIAVLERGELLTVKGSRELFADPGSVGAALITGCENVVKARKSGAYSVEVPEWNAIFRTSGQVGEDVEAIGIRAQDFGSEILENSRKITIIRELEELSSRVLEFRFIGQTLESESVLCRLSNEAGQGNYPEKLGIDGAKILLLYSSR